MIDRQIPLKSLYRALIDFPLKVNADNYILAGWQSMEIYPDLADFIRRIRVKEAIPLYRVGWIRSAGEPAYPPVIDEGQPPRTQEFGPSVN